MPTEEVELRPVRGLGDAQAMRRVRNECREFMTSNTSEIGKFEQFTWWLRVGRSRDWRIYLLWNNDQPVGYGILRRKGCQWWVTGGLVESSRGIGLGRFLFSELLRLADSPTAYLEVRISNTKALNLYRSLGFRFINSKDEDTLVMMAIRQ